MIFPEKVWDQATANIADDMHPKLLLFLETLDHIKIPKMFFPLLKYRDWSG